MCCSRESARYAAGGCLHPRYSSARTAAMTFRSPTAGTGNIIRQQTGSMRRYRKIPFHTSPIAVSQAFSSTMKAMDTDIYATGSNIWETQASDGTSGKNSGYGWPDPRFSGQPIPSCRFPFTGRGDGAGRRMHAQGGGRRPLE